MTRLKYGLILLGLLAVLGIRGYLNRNTNRAESGLASSATPALSATPDFTRVIPAKDIGKLVNKPRSVWVKTLGKPTEKSAPPFKDIAGESWGGVDTWTLGSKVQVTVVWTEARLPYGISFATVKGAQVLSLTEVDTLASYFGLGAMYTKPHVLPTIHFWGTDKDPIQASAAGESTGLAITINSPGKVPVRGSP
jgi:hypothetical protein